MSLSIKIAESIGDKTSSRSTSSELRDVLRDILRTAYNSGSTLNVADVTAKFAEYVKIKKLTDAQYKALVQCRDASHFGGDATYNFDNFVIKSLIAMRLNDMQLAAKKVGTEAVYKIDSEKLFIVDESGEYILDKSGEKMPLLDESGKRATKPIVAEYYIKVVPSTALPTPTVKKSGV